MSIIGGSELTSYVGGGCTGLFCLKAPNFEGIITLFLIYALIFFTIRAFINYFKKLKKKWVKISILLILIIILYGLYYSISGVQGSKVCWPILDQKNKDHCYIEFAARNLDIDTCDKILSNYYKQECKDYIYSKLARDVETCQKIYNNATRKTCYDKRYQYLTISNISFCEQLPEFKDECYRKIRACSYIETLSIRDECFLDLATFFDDISICKNISVQEQKDICYGMIITNNYEKYDPSICENILDVSDKGCTESFGCHYEYRGCYQGCFFRRDHCYNRMAEIKNDSTLCSQINESYTKDGCYSHFAYKTLNSTFCDYINGSVVTIRGNCSITINKADFNCSGFINVRDIVNKKNCSVNSNKRSFQCSGFINVLDQSEEVKNQCYYDIAQFSNNFSSCSKITEYYMQRDCYKNNSF